jgi:hypothetical protein
MHVLDTDVPVTRARHDINWCHTDVPLAGELCRRVRNNLLLSLPALTVVDLVAYETTPRELVIRSRRSYRLKPHQVGSTEQKYPDTSPMCSIRHPRRAIMAHMSAWTGRRIPSRKGCPQMKTWRGVKMLESCQNEEVVCPTCLQYELVSIRAELAVS